MAFPLLLKITKARLLWTAVIAGGAAVSVGLLEASSTNEFCYLCHFDQRFQQPWRASAHYEGGVHCKDCHFGPGVGGLVDAKYLGLKDAAFALTTAEDFNNVEIYTHAQEEKCRKCHNAFAKTNVSSGQDLAAGMAAAVGNLTYDHAAHEKASETCKKCHAKDTYFFSANYMTCESCHGGLVHELQEEPGRARVSADRCSRCHTGRMHVWGEKAKALADGGVFFFNDCPAANLPIADGVVSDKPNCNRCHAPVEVTRVSLPRSQ